MGVRYFYTDPLAAAWQAKHFGMQFIGWEWNDELFHFNSLVHADDEDSGAPYCPDGSKVYVHPDSTKLLEPQAGDLLLVGKSEDEPEYLLVKANPLGSLYAISGSERYYVASKNQFIQRKGIPFMTPESEAA